MGFYYDAHASIGCLKDNVGQCHLRPRMEVKLRLFNKDDLIASGGKERNKYRQGLGYTKSDVRDIDSIPRAALRSNG